MVAGTINVARLSTKMMDIRSAIWKIDEWMIHEHPSVWMTGTMYCHGARSPMVPDPQIVIAVHA